MRRQQRTGRFLACQLGVSAASVSRIQPAARLRRRQESEPALELVCIKRAKPGELIHLNVKRLGRIKGIGHRIHRDRSNALRSHGIGWDYVQVAIDNNPRIVLADVVDDERRDTAIATFTGTLSK